MELFYSLLYKQTLKYQSQWKVSLDLKLSRKKNYSVSN